uniref:Pitrilysin metallepetidase 1 n=1 Tax=Mus musculus TaxID=10090 RepID=A0A1Y7VMS3_MOUSE
MWRFSGRRGLCAVQRLSCGVHHRVWREKSDQACERALQYKVGEKIHGFTVNQVPTHLSCCFLYESETTDFVLVFLGPGHSCPRAVPDSREAQP